MAVVAAGAALVIVPADGADGAPRLELSVRKRVPARAVPDKGQPDGSLPKVEGIAVTPAESKRTIDPRKTAIVVCDMWDDHWCQSAARRCGELAKRAEPVLKAARERGITIVHAPSDCMKFYADHPARKRTLAAARVEPPKPKDLPNPPLPVDDSDGGCDDVPPAKFSKAWARQHPAITIDPGRDFISDSGHEVYSVLAGKGITTLIVMGVHTNMCVLNRTFAIKQMVKWGVDVLLVRDLTDAMYNPKMRPFVPHERGTELIVEYVETYWCPTIEARQLTGTR